MMRHLEEFVAFIINLQHTNCCLFVFLIFIQFFEELKEEREQNETLQATKILK
jgi:hypothetical protein